MRDQARLAASFRYVSNGAMPSPMASAYSRGCATRRDADEYYRLPGEPRHISR